MHLNQSLHKRQSNTKATLGAVQSSLCLREEIENVRQEVGRYSDTRIPHTQDGFVSFLLKGDPNFSAFAGVLGGVGKQVRHHLFKANWVSMQPNRFW